MPRRITVPSLSQFGDSKTLPSKLPRLSAEKESADGLSNKPAGTDFQSWSLAKATTDGTVKKPTEQQSEAVAKPAPSNNKVDSLHENPDIPGPSTSKEVPEVEASSGTTVPSSSSYGGRSITVSQRQRGNPVLKYIRNVPWEYGDTLGDFQIAPACVALFLSLKFHRLNPEYIHERLKKLGHRFKLQLLFLQIDVQEPKNLLREINKICTDSCCTLMLGYNAEQTARYIELFKLLENKPPDLIMGKSEDTDNRTALIDFLTAFRSINRTDAEALISTFGSLARITDATEEELCLLPGFGPLKAKKLYKGLHEQIKFG